MFERVDVDSNASNVHRKNKRLQRLLDRYVEDRTIKRLQQLKHKAAKQTVEQIRHQVRRELQKKIYPEETYETWHKRGKRNDELLSTGGDDSIDQGTIDDTIDDDDDDDDDKVVPMHNSGLQYWTRTNFLIKTKGFEILPTSNETLGFCDNSRINVMNHNIDNIKTLVHLNVLRGNWDSAYKLFCLLIRIPKVDLRSLWPVGIEILLRKFNDNHIDNDGDDTTQRAKHRMFYEWLSSFLILYNYQPSSDSESLRLPRNISAPVWRSGSKTHTPLYVTGFLWQLLIDGEYKTLKEKVDELLLEPPYNADGMFYFLKVILHLYEAVELVNEYRASRDSHVRNDVLLLVSSMEQLVDKCTEFEFEVPPQWFQAQTEILLKYISDDQKSKQDSEKSTGERSDDGEESDQKSDNSDTKDNSDGWGDISSDSDSESEENGLARTEKEQTPLSEPVPYDGWSDIEDDVEDDDDFMRKNNDNGVSVDDDKQLNELEFDFDFE